VMPPGRLTGPSLLPHTHTCAGRCDHAECVRGNRSRGLSSAVLVVSGCLVMDVCLVAIKQADLHVQSCIGLNTNALLLAVLNRFFTITGTSVPAHGTGHPLAPIPELRQSQTLHLPGLALHADTVPCMCQECGKSSGIDVQVTSLRAHP
jgi:hypothetical protein